MLHSCPFFYYKSSLCNSKSMLRKARDSASLAIQGTFPRLVSGGLHREVQASPDFYTV